jgi:hypothetical protein
MDGYQLGIVMLAIADMHRHCDHRGKCRQMTPEELDELADYGWHLPDLKGKLTACVNAVRVRWQPRASHRIEPSTVPSAAAPSQG